MVMSFSHVAQSSYWNCLCDCGNMKVASAACLRKANTRSCGCLNTGAWNVLPANTKDETGKTYGNLIVLGYSHSKDGTHWHCLCSCGKETIVASHSFRRGMTKSCGCKAYDRTPGNKLPGHGGLYNRLIKTYKAHARKRSYLWELTDEEATNLFKGNCFFCNSGPTNFLAPLKHYRDGINYNGIDRRDNEEGYNIENTVSCCKYCNSSKSDRTEKEFLEWASRLVAHQKLLTDMSL